MPAEEVLIMAVTRMLSGVCTACFTPEPHDFSHLRWARPVKESGSLILGDLTDASGRVIQCCDVVEMHIGQAHPSPPHVEDRITDFVYHRPRVLRRLEGKRRARFLSEHLDKTPEDVVGEHPSRSLCLVRPERFWARFKLDAYSRKYQARMGFILDGVSHPQPAAPRGVSVTDLKWRALGRTWMPPTGGVLQLDEDEVNQRLEADDIYLALGLSRDYRGKTWLLVIGVHLEPDYQVEIDYQNL